MLALLEVHTQTGPRLEPRPSTPVELLVDWLQVGSAAGADQIHTMPGCDAQHEPLYDHEAHMHAVRTRLSLASNMQWDLCYTPRVRYPRRYARSPFSMMASDTCL